jgi:hypothetical protein
MTGTWLDRMADELNQNGYHKYCIWGDHRHDASARVAAEYTDVLNAAADERPLQKFLEKHPDLLIDAEGGHCRWVVPQKSLSGKFIPDFLICRLDSLGLNWTLVELQSPRAKLFTKKGEPAEQLREGLHQVTRWRIWLENNRDAARRKQNEDGLGLVGISAYSRGLVIIGREGDRTPANRDYLLRLRNESGIDIHSYDWLARDALIRISARDTYSKGVCVECGKMRTD